MLRFEICVRSKYEIFGKSHGLEVDDFVKTIPPGIYNDVIIIKTCHKFKHVNKPNLTMLWKSFRDYLHLYFYIESRA